MNVDTQVPKYTTIRVNKCIVDDEHYNESFDELQSFLDDAFQKDRNLTAPKLEIAHDLLRECLVFKSIDDDHAKKEMPPVEEVQFKLNVIFAHYCCMFKFELFNLSLRKR